MFHFLPFVFLTQLLAPRGSVQKQTQTCSLGPKSGTRIKPIGVLCRIILVFNPVFLRNSSSIYMLERECALEIYMSPSSIVYKRKKKKSKRLPIGEMDK